MNSAPANLAPGDAPMSGVLAYGVGDFAMNLYWNSLSLLLLFWYTHVAGVSATTAGVIFLIGTIWDAATDPVMAAVAERTRTPWGSYRPYIPVGGLALAAAFVVLMWVPPLTGGWLVAALIAAHILFRTCYTLVGVPYSALSSRLTTDARRRTLLAGVRMIFAYLGFFAVSFAAFPIVRAFGGSDTSPEGFLAFAVVCGAVAMVTYLACFTLCAERPAPAPPRASIGAQLAGLLLSVRGNPAIHTMLVFISFQAAASFVFLSTMTFFVAAHAAQFAPVEAVLTVNATAMLLATPVWTWLAHRFGKRRTWFVASAVFGAAAAHLAVFGPLVMFGAPAQLVFMGMGMGAFGVLIWSMIPDSIEYGEWRTGVRSEASAFGMAMVVQKSAIALTALCVGMILDAIGVSDADASGGEQRAAALTYLFALGPTVLLAVSAVFVHAHPVSSESHRSIVEAIGRRRSANAAE